MNFAIDVFAWTMVGLGTIVAFYIFAEICWRLFLVAFKIVDRIVNNY